MKSPRFAEQGAFQVTSTMMNIFRIGKSLGNGGHRFVEFRNSFLLGFFRPEYLATSRFLSLGRL